MKKILKTFFLLVVFLLVGILVVWRVDRAYFHPYMPERQEEIQSVVTTYKFTVPQDEASCLAKGGTWKKIGIRPREECNLPTTDEGKICSGSNQCEGVCLAELTKEQMEKGIRGRLFKTDGKCSGWIKLVGCRAYVYRGWASVVCAD